MAGLVPSEADELAGGGDEESLRRALELEPDHASARRELGRLLLERGERDAGARAARGRARRLRGRRARRARPARPATPSSMPAFEAWDEGDHAAALELLQAALADPERRDLVRRVMVAIFTELGPTTRWRASTAAGCPPR